MAVDEDALEQLCVCGHPQGIHFGLPGRGACLHEAQTEPWACGCDHFEGQEAL